MGQYSNNPVIEGRYDAYGRQTYWKHGFLGQGKKVAIIDDYSEQHAYQMLSVRDYIAPRTEVVQLDMKGSAQGIRDMLYEAVKQKVDIVSLSRSTDGDTMDLHDAVKACYNAGILVVCSAGNTGEKFQDSVDIKRYPAAYDETISVLCIDNSFVPSKYSSHGSTGTVTAFGQNVLVKSKTGEEMLVDGTSAPTAAIAFMMALHLCKLDSVGKKMTAQQMIDFVKANTADWGVVGKDNMTGYGFFTLDKSEFERVKLMMSDRDGNGLSERVDRIKALIALGTPYDEAQRVINRQYFIVAYEVLNGVASPLYGGRIPM